MIKIAAIGDTNVDCYLNSGLMYPGGNCLNVSIFARRFNAHSAFIGAIGIDQAGELIRGTLEQEGVDTTQLRLINGKTAYCLIDHVDGDRVFTESDLGVSRFRPTQEDLDYLKNFDAAHVGQTSGLDEFVPSIAHNALLSYDFSTRREKSHYREISGHCFLASFSGGNMTTPEITALKNDVIVAGAQWVLITRGRSGAILANAKRSYQVSAVPTTVVDTLGAGDTFITRTLIGLLRDEDPTEALAAAAEAAAETCSYWGPHSKGKKFDM